MSRICVVDTNVVVSALLGRKEGASRKVLRACLEQRILPLMGESLFNEYEDVLSRDALFSSCPLSRVERDRLLDTFFSVCQWVMIYYTWRPNLRDEADNHLIELAVAGNAESIVTKNIKDFQGSQLHFPQLRILSPDAFINEGV